MRKFWLITTDHLEDRLWFREDDDFKVGMNYVAVLSWQQGIVLLAFILMSNHVHFVVYCTRREAEEFINEYKRRYSIYMRRKYNQREFLRSNNVDIKPIPDDEPEALERVIAYVQMNCVAAAICSHPSQYPWGCGNVFFSQSGISGQKLGELSKRARERLLHSECVRLPEEWLIEDGIILPCNYVDVKMVEECFRTPKRMNYFLNSSSKAKKRIETTEKQFPAFRDQVILLALPDLYRTLFQKDSFRELNPAEQTELLRQIRFRFSANINQIARVTGIAYSDAARIIDGDGV